MVVGIPDVFTYTIFCDDSGFGVHGACQILLFPIDFRRRPQNTKSLTH